MIPDSTPASSTVKSPLIMAEPTRRILSCSSTSMASAEPSFLSCSTSFTKKSGTFNCRSGSPQQPMAVTTCSMVYVVPERTESAAA